MIKEQQANSGEASQRMPNNCFGIQRLSAIHLQFMGPKALPAIRGKLCEEKKLEIPIFKVSMLLYRVSVCQKKVMKSKLIVSTEAITKTGREVITLNY